MRKLRFYFGVVRLFIRRFIIHITLGILLGFFAFVFRGYAGEFPLFSSVQRIGILGQYTPDRPPIAISQFLSQGLTMLSDSGVPQPGLAQNWQQQDEGREWTFTLRPNSLWQDRSIVKPQDFHYKFPDVEALYPNNSTVKFKLRDPYAAFPVLVSRPIFKKGLIGTSDWHVKSISLEGQYMSQMTLENSKTHQEKLFRFYETEHKLRSAFKLGEIDTISEIYDPQELSDWKNATVDTQVQTNRYVGLFFNTKQPVFEDNKNLRQALAYAINKEKLSDRRALGPISPKSWAYNALVKPYEYDIKHARGLLEKLKSDQKPTEISIATSPSLLTQAQSIAKDWEALNIKTKIQVTPGIPHDYQVLLATIEIPPDPDQYSLWHSTQTETNITHLNNARIDKLLEDGRKTLDQDTRKKIYLDFQRFLVEEAPAVFLYYPKSYIVTRKVK